jgi:hypothetical protein
MRNSLLRRSRRGPYPNTHSTLYIPITFTTPIAKLAARCAFASLTRHTPTKLPLTDFEVEVVGTLIANGINVDARADRETRKLYLMSPCCEVYDDDDIILDVYVSSLADYIQRCAVRGYNPSQIADGIKFLLGITGIGRSCVRTHLKMTGQYQKKRIQYY